MSQIHVLRYIAVIKEKVVEIDNRLKVVESVVTEVHQDVKKLLEFKAGFIGVNKAVVVAACVAGIISAVWKIVEALVQ